MPALITATTSPNFPDEPCIVFETYKEAKELLDSSPALHYLNLGVEYLKVWEVISRQAYFSENNHAFLDKVFTDWDGKDGNGIIPTYFSITEFEVGKSFCCWL